MKTNDICCCLGCCLVMIRHCWQKCKLLQSFWKTVIQYLLFFPLGNPVPGTTSPVQNVPYTFAHKGKNVRRKINTHS